MADTPSILELQRVPEARLYEIIVQQQELIRELYDIIERARDKIDALEGKLEELEDE